jgi:hypothetical protein
VHFSNELCYGYLRSEGNWANFFSYLPKEIFPISFKPKVAIAKFIGKMQKKSGIMKSGLEAIPLFLLDDLLNKDKKQKNTTSSNLGLELWCGSISGISS